MSTKQPYMYMYMCGSFVSTVCYLNGLWQRAGSKTICVRTLFHALCTAVRTKCFCFCASMGCSEYRTTKSKEGVRLNVGLKVKVLRTAL